MPGDPGKEGIAAAHGKQLCEPTDTVKSFKRGKPFLVQHLHHQIGIYQEAVPFFLRKSCQLHQSGYKGLIEDTVVKDPFRVIVIKNAHRAHLLRFTEKAPERAFVLHKQSHLESLVSGSVFLGTDVGDIQIETVNQLQHVRHASGNIPQHEFQQDNAVFIFVCLEVSDFYQLSVCL